MYETDPVGGPDDQGAFLNMVVELDTVLTARDLLEVCRQTEAVGGRSALSIGGRAPSTSTSSGSTASRSTSPISASRIL